MQYFNKVKSYFSGKVGVRSSTLRVDSCFDYSSYDALKSLQVGPVYLLLHICPSKRKRVDKHYCKDVEAFVKVYLHLSRYKQGSPRKSICKTPDTKADTRLAALAAHVKAQDLLQCKS